MDAHPPIRILVADDHACVQEGLIAIFSRQADMCVVAQAFDGQEAIDLYRFHLPDIVLMDLRMPNVSGVDAIRALCAEFPTASILACSAFREGAEQALQAGAKGFVLKDTDREELLASIRAVASVAEA